MKKIFTVIVVFVLTLTSTIVTAQTAMVVHNDKPTASLSDAAYKHSITVSKRISKWFEKSFPGITDAAWQKDGDGFMVRFTTEGIQNWAFFSRQGVCYGRIRYYTENDLPDAVRNQIEKTYDDFEITSVQEVYAKVLTTYLVTISDAATWKLIRVADGETDVLEEHVK